MKFDDKSRPQQIRHAKKRLPYTVTNIGGEAELAHWKAERLKLDNAWLQAKEQRKQEVISGMNDGSLAQKEYGESETTKAYKRYEADQNKHKEQAKYRADMPKKDVHTTKPSILTRIYNWCMDFFLSIKLS